MANYTATTNPLELRLSENVTVRAVFSLAPAKPSPTPTPSLTPPATPRATPQASPQPSPTPQPSPSPSITPPTLDRTFLATISPSGLAEPPGIIIGPDGERSAGYVINTRPGRQIALTAVPVTGWQFFRWENRVGGTLVQQVGQPFALLTVENTTSIQSEENTWSAVFTPIPSSTPLPSPSATPQATPPASPVPPEQTPPATPPASPNATPPATPPASPPATPPASPLPPEVSPLPPTPTPTPSRAPRTTLTFQVQSVPGSAGVGGVVRLPDGRTGTYFIENVTQGTRLTVVAIANEGWKFTGWKKLVNTEFTTLETTPTLAITADTATTYYPTFVKQWRDCETGNFNDDVPPSDFVEVAYPGAGGGFCWEPRSGVGFLPALDTIKFRYQRGTSVYPDPLSIRATNSSYAVAFNVKMTTNSDLFEIIPAQTTISPRTGKIFTIQPRPDRIGSFGDGTTTFSLEVETTPV